MHPIGYFISRQRMINLLCVRLRAEEMFKKHPEILEQELYPVWMILGLQRTGTTKLHRLLAADKDHRVLLSWEALNPAPLSDDPSELKKRIGVAKTSENALKIMAPGFFAIHPVMDKFSFTSLHHLSGFLRYLGLNGTSADSAEESAVIAYKHFCPFFPGR